MWFVGHYENYNNFVAEQKFATLGSAIEFAISREYKDRLVIGKRYSKFYVYKVRRFCKNANKFVKQPNQSVMPFAGWGV